jgi:hypothetical protein
MFRKDGLVTLSEAFDQLKAARRLDDGSKTSLLCVKLAALNIVRACDQEAMTRELRTLPIEQQQDCVFGAVLQQIAGT